MLNNLDPAVALADLANIILDPDIKLPVQVYHEKKTTTDVTINCLESDDLQGFKPLSKSSIGDVSFFRSISSIFDPLRCVGRFISTKVFEGFHKSIRV